MIDHVPVSLTIRPLLSIGHFFTFFNSISTRSYKPSYLNFLLCFRVLCFANVFRSFLATRRWYNKEMQISFYSYFPRYILCIYLCKLSTVVEFFSILSSVGVLLILTLSKACNISCILEVTVTEKLLSSISFRFRLSFELSSLHNFHIQFVNFT